MQSIYTSPEKAHRVATKIITKQPPRVMELIGEDRLRELWEQDAIQYDKRARKIGTAPNCGTKAGGARANETLTEQMLECFDEGEWLDLNECIKRSGQKHTQARNTLDRLYTTGRLDKKVVSRSGNGLVVRGGGKSYWMLPNDHAVVNEQQKKIMAFCHKPRRTRQVADMLCLGVSRTNAILIRMCNRGMLVKELEPRPQRGGLFALWTTVHDKDD